MYADIKSLKQNSYAQVFTHKVGFAVGYPRAKANGDTIGYALQDFIHDYGAPYHLVVDSSMRTTILLTPLIGGPLG